MKKTIGFFSALFILSFIISGCQQINGGNAADTSENDYYNPNGSQSETSDEPWNITEALSTSQNAEETIETTIGEGQISDSSEQIIQTAESLLGVPFVMNGAAPDTGFDNSGFIYYVLRENGFINCPRLTGEQAAMGTHTDYDGLKKGDLVFFSVDNSGNADFGGIYIGEGLMVYCPMPGQTVQTVDIRSDYWLNAFYIGVRLS